MFLHLIAIIGTFQVAPAEPVFLEKGEVPRASQLFNIRLEEALRQTQRWRRYALYGPETPDKPPIKPEEANYMIFPGKGLTISYKDASAKFSFDTGAMESFQYRLDDNRDDSHLPFMPQDKAIDLAKRYWRAAGMETDGIRWERVFTLPRRETQYIFTPTQQQEGLPFSQSDGSIQLDSKRGTLVLLTITPRVHRVHPGWRTRIDREAARRSAIAALARYEAKPTRLVPKDPTLDLRAPGFSRLMNEMDEEQRGCERRHICLPTYIFPFDDPASYNEYLGIAIRQIVVYVDARNGRAMAIFDRNSIGSFRAASGAVPVKAVWPEFSGKPITLGGKKLAPGSHVAPAEGSVNAATSVPVTITAGSEVYALRYDRKNGLLWYGEAEKASLARPSTALRKELDKVVAPRPFGSVEKKG